MTARRLLLLRLRASLWFAARLMPLQISGLGLAPIIAAYEPGASRSFVGLEPRQILDAIRRVTHHPWAMRDRRCFRQGLLAYRYLGMAGFRPELHFGIDRQSLTDQHVSAHCWVVLDGNPVLNPPDDKMVTLFIHDGPQSIDTARTQFRVADAPAVSHD